jgi:tyrosyl-tRNA synthetase
MKDTLTGADLNSAKILLADEATRLLHGPTVLQSIHTTAQNLFHNNDKTAEAEMNSLPVHQVRRSEIVDGRANILDLFIRVKLADSKSAVRRLIQNGGVRVNDVKVLDEKYCIGMNDFDVLGRLKLSSGKKTHILVELVDIL